MYICPACGAGLKFNPTSQMLECEYCDSKFKLEEIKEEQLKTAKGQNYSKNEENNEDNFYDVNIFNCTQCGAELLTTDETLATFCSYCGSSALLQKNSKKTKKPSYIIPFTKSREECEKAYKKMLRKAFFAPNSMIKDSQVQKIRGIYMPYWVYSYEKNGLQVDKGSRYHCRRGDYVYYDDYEIKTNLETKCNGITHDASANFSDTLSEAIGPFSINERKEFSPKYLTGFYADSEDVNSDIYVTSCRTIAEKKAERELAKDNTYSRYRAHPSIKMQNTSSELGLFPVYFLSTKTSKGDRISYAVVNGQTGKTAAEIPIDFKKYLLFSAILSAVIFIIMNFVFTVTPVKVLILATIFSIASLIISFSQVDKIYKRENNLNDKGAVAKENKKMDENEKNPTKKMFINKKNSIPFGERIKKSNKPLIAIIIEIIIFIINPVSDMVYYIGASVAILAAILSIFDLVKGINLLTTRKLPHLESRGGDENA